MLLLYHNITDCCIDNTMHSGHTFVPIVTFLGWKLDISISLQLRASQPAADKNITSDNYRIYNEPVLLTT